MYFHITSGRFGRYVFFSVLIITVLSLVISINVEHHRGHPPDNLTYVQPPQQEPVGIQPAQLYREAKNHLYRETKNRQQVVQIKIKKNQRLLDLVQGYYISPENYRQMLSLPPEKFDFRAIRPGRRCTLVADKDSLRSLRRLVYEESDTIYFQFLFTDSLRVKREKKEIHIKEKILSATIRSSLWETIIEKQIDYKLVNRLTEIFEQKIDFYTLWPGDQFKVIYESKNLEGNEIDIGRIKGAYFKHIDDVYYAIGYEKDQTMEYFDEKGNNYQAILLKYPIEFSRISSRYTYRRLHPVYKKIRSHLGVDLVAPRGTPIRSVGEGTVIRATYSKNNGKYVKIKHNNLYTTGYLHMSKIASSMYAGATVSRGQVIGYVGSTGLATGPHLCYRFWKRGKQVNALKVKLPFREGISEQQRPHFLEIKQAVMQKLENISFSMTPSKETNP